MPLTSDEIALFEVAKAALPREFFDSEEDAREFFYACAKVFGLAKTQVDEWISQTRISEATGIWLEQHARDQGTRKQNGESEDSLRARLRFPEDAVNIPSLVRNNLLRVQNIGTAGATSYTYTVLFDNGSGDLRLVGINTTATGNATLNSTNFNRLSGYGYGAGSYLVYRTDGGATQGLIATVTNTASVDDTGLVGDGATVPRYLPPSAEGVATAMLRSSGGDADHGYPGLVELRKDKAFIGTTGSGNSFAYVNRGYRVGELPRKNTIIILLPYGTTAATANAIAEAARQRKGAGIIVQVERRLNP